MTYTASYSALANRASDPRFNALIAATLADPGVANNPVAGMAKVADAIRCLHRMPVENHGHALVVTLASSRSNKPACMVISANTNQEASASADMVYRGALYITQVFPGGANDDVGPASENVVYRVKTQGRMLQC